VYRSLAISSSPVSKSSSESSNSSLPSSSSKESSKLILWAAFFSSLKLLTNTFLLLFNFWLPLFSSLPERLYLLCVMLRIFSISWLLSAALYEETVSVFWIVPQSLYLPIINACSITSLSLCVFCILSCIINLNWFSISYIELRTPPILEE
jgi:hypothetical protein